MSVLRLESVAVDDIEDRNEKNEGMIKVRKKNKVLKSFTDDDYDEEMKIRMEIYIETKNFTRWWR